MFRSLIALVTALAAGATSLLSTGRAGAGARPQVRARFHQPGPACAVVRGARQGLLQRRRPQRHHHAVEGHGGRDPDRRHRRRRARLHRHPEPGRVRQRRRRGEDRRGQLPEAALLHLHLESRRQRHRAEADGGPRARLEHGIVRAEDLGGVHGNEQGRQQDAQGREHRCRLARAHARGRQGAVDRSVPDERARHPPRGDQCEAGLPVRRRLRPRDLRQLASASPRTSWRRTPTW